MIVLYHGKLNICRRSSVLPICYIFLLICHWQTFCSRTSSWMTGLDLICAKIPSLGCKAVAVIEPVCWWWLFQWAFSLMGRMYTLCLGHRVQLVGLLVIFFIWTIHKWLCYLFDLQTVCNFFQLCWLSLLHMSIKISFVTPYCDGGTDIYTMNILLSAKYNVGSLVSFSARNAKWYCIITTVSVHIV